MPKSGMWISPRIFSTSFNCWRRHQKSDSTFAHIFGKRFSKAFPWTIMSLKTHKINIFFNSQTAQVSSIPTVSSLLQKLLSLRLDWAYTETNAQILNKRIDWYKRHAKHYEFIYVILSCHLPLVLRRHYLFFINLWKKPPLNRLLFSLFSFCFLRYEINNKKYIYLSSLLPSCAVQFRFYFWSFPSRHRSPFLMHLTYYCILNMKQL